MPFTPPTAPATPTEIWLGSRLIGEVTKKLKAVPGAEAAFILGNQITVVAREHSDIGWEELVDVEDWSSGQDPDFEFNVRVHQGRDINQMFPGWERLF